MKTGLQVFFLLSIIAKLFFKFFFTFYKSYMFIVIDKFWFISDSFYIVIDISTLVMIFHRSNMISSFQRPRNISLAFSTQFQCPVSHHFRRVLIKFLTVLIPQLAYLTVFKWFLGIWPMILALFLSVLIFGSYCIIFWLNVFLKYIIDLLLIMFEA